MTTDDEDTLEDLARAIADLARQRDRKREDPMGWLHDLALLLAEGDALLDHAREQITGPAVTDPEPKAKPW